MKDQSKFMLRAIELSIQSAKTKGGPFGCVIVTQQLGYFWRPEEVSLQKDRSDYQTLRPEQKHIFTSNLKYQILRPSLFFIHTLAEHLHDYWFFFLSNLLHFWVIPFTPFVRMF